MTESPVEAIRQHPILGTVSGTSLSNALPLIEAFECSAGDYLFREGNQANYMYLITHGHAEKLNNEGQSKNSDTISLVGQEAAGLHLYIDSVRALTDLKGWRIPREALSQIIAEKPNLSAELLHSNFSRDTLSQRTETRAEKEKISQAVPLSAIIGWLLAIAIPPALYFAADAIHLTTQASLFLAITGAVITMWVFSLVPEFVPPLLALVYMLFVGLAPASVVLSSFASPSMMTLLGVFALAAMISSSGLSNRALLWLLLHLPSRSIWYQFSLILYGFLLSLGTPSGNNRMSLIFPAFDSMSRSLRLKAHSLTMTALFAATYAGAMLFSASLATSKSASIAVFGLIPPHQQTYYGGVFWIGAAAFASVLLVILHFVTSRLVFGTANTGLISKSLLAERLSLLGPWRTSEIITSLCLIVFLVGSMSTSLHHVNPAAIAGIVLIALLLTGVMTKNDLQKNVDWPTMVYLIATDCLIKTMDYLGLSAQLATFLQTYITFISGQIVVFLALSCLIVIVLRFLFPIPAGMLLSALILIPISQAEGINIWICIFAIAVFSDIWFFKYQNTIYMIAVDMGVLSKIDERAFLQQNMLMNFARIVVVFASVPIWTWMGIA